MNRYKANKELKEYKVSRVKKGVAKNGTNYTTFSVADSQVVNGVRQYDNYTVFAWQDLKMADGDKIVFEDILGWDFKEREYNGKKYFDKTIFATVRVTSNSAEANKVEVVGELPKFDESESSGLPF